MNLKKESYCVTLKLTVTKVVEATSRGHAINVMKVIVRNAMPDLQVEFKDE